ADIEALEALAEQVPGVVGVTSFVGRGASRFTTIMNPEQPNPAYAQMVVRVADVTEMDGQMVELGGLVRAAKPDAEVQVTRAEFTPSGSSKIEARFSGPDDTVLRELADTALQVYLKHELVDRKTDWRQPVLQLVPEFNQSRAQLAGVTRTDLSQALAFATLGVQVGLYREADKLIPIVARAPQEERWDVQNLMDRQVWSPAQQRHVPMSQIVDSLRLEADNATIYRRDRVRTIKALANPPVGHNPTRTFNRIRGDVEAIVLPPGYKLEWGGEFEASQEANDILISKIPMALGTMFLITILMFGKLTQPIIIWLTVPMTICGVVLALLATDLSFTFPSFLGFLSLSGMLIKNCIVLVDEIDKRCGEAGFTLENMMRASVSRLRPVMLAAGTTIAGMSPLLGDAFFQEMAVCIMGGLAFATLLTLLAVPVFYRLALGRRVTG
ncbi:MAG: efflux RND transporter permease subunit, partial [Pseudomonadota bacterium]